MKIMKVVSAILAALLVLAACAPSEPMISEDASRQIGNALGYALAPAYLPAGFEPGRTSGGTMYMLTKTPMEGSTWHATLLYEEYSPDRQSKTTLFLTYPENYAKSSRMMDELGMDHPEDAVSEITINGETAYLFHGRWTRETMDRLARLDTSQDPEWDYDNGGHSIRFQHVIPNGDRIWVSLATVFPTDQITEEDIVKIAESIVTVE